jgi:Fe-S oxidoreductase
VSYAKLKGATTPRQRLSLRCCGTFVYIKIAREIVRKNSKNNKQEMEKKFNYQQQYGVIVICRDETEQIRIYEELKKQGLTLKVVTV